MRMMDSVNANNSQPENVVIKPIIPGCNGLNTRRKLISCPNNQPYINRRGSAARFNQRA
jgi:hypothetical protein